MPYHTIYNGRNRVAYIECTTHGTIKAATGRFVWSVGKSVQTLNEWLHRHNLRSERAEGEAAIDLCRSHLVQQQKLENVS